MQAYLTDHG